VTVDFKINDFVKARLGSHIRYDDDIKVNEVNEDGENIDAGSAIQWKQLLGVGLLIEL
jgi:hypothetical protein